MCLISSYFRLERRGLLFFVCSSFGVVATFRCSEMLMLLSTHVVSLFWGFFVSVLMNMFFLPFNCLGSYLILNWLSSVAPCLPQILLCISCWRPALLSNSWFFDSCSILPSASGVVYLPCPLFYWSLVNGPVLLLSADLEGLFGWQQGFAFRSLPVTFFVNCSFLFSPWRDCVLGWVCACKLSVLGGLSVHVLRRRPEGEGFSVCYATRRVSEQGWWWRGLGPLGRLTFVRLRGALGLFYITQAGGLRQRIFFWPPLFSRKAAPLLGDLGCLCMCVCPRPLSYVAPSPVASQMTDAIPCGTMFRCCYRAPVPGRVRVGHLGDPSI